MPYPRKHDVRMATESPDGAGADAPGLAAEVRHRLGPPQDEPREPPLVSIVVPNRDGAHMLRRLLCGLTEHTAYDRFELIVVDNGSTDDSIELIRSAPSAFPISVVANQHNESFSDACNQGAELASGELLLFLNNDVEPFEGGWLQELVACLLRSPVGAVSATLVCRDEEHERDFPYGYGVQHRGIGFREEGGMLAPMLQGWEADPLDDELGMDVERQAVAAACLMIERSVFERVGGFSHGYFYGAEDIDLCLKLRDAGLPVLLSGRSIAIHHPVSTRRAAPFEQQLACKLANRRVLWERWGPQLRREYELSRQAGDGRWPLGVCLEDANPSATPDLSELRTALEQRGYRCLLLQGGRAEDPIGLEYDVAVHFRGRTRYVPRPARCNLLVDLEPSGGIAAQERDLYDLVLPGAADFAALERSLLEALSELGLRLRQGGLARR